jgi:hypothetical protein
MRLHPRDERCRGNIPTRRRDNRGDSSSPPDSRILLDRMPLSISSLRVPHPWVGTISATG